MEYNRSEIATMRDFVDWMLWVRYTIKDLLNNGDEVIREYIDWKYR